MARPRPPRPAPKRVPTSTLAPSRTTAVTPITHWKRDAVVVRLTNKLHGLVAAAARRSADDVVAIGTQLARIHERLERGLWLQWVAENAGFGRSTANNYIELSAWAQRAPAEFARLRHLGPGKLYVLASATPKRVRGLKPGKLVAVPTTGLHKTIENMTTPELAAVVGDLATPPVVQPPIEKLVRGVRFKVAELGAAADAMLARADEVEVEVVQDIREELLEVLARIEGAL